MKAPFLELNGSIESVRHLLSIDEWVLFYADLSFALNLALCYVMLRLSGGTRDTLADVDALEKAFVAVGEKQLDVKELDSVEPDLLKKMLKHWIQHIHQGIRSDREAGDVGPSKRQSDGLQEVTEALKHGMRLPEAQPDETTATPAAEKLSFEEASGQDGGLHREEAAQSSEEEFSREQWMIGTTVLIG